MINPDPNPTPAAYCQIKARRVSHPPDGCVARHALQGGFLRRDGAEASTTYSNQWTVPASNRALLGFNQALYQTSSLSHDPSSTRLSLRRQRSSGWI